jgi:hypothetical protein
MDRVGTIRGEVNASIIKGLFESQGIESSIAPDGMHLSSGASPGPAQPYSVYVQRDKVDQAVALLKEHNFMSA